MALISFEEFKKRRTAGESADDIFGSSTRSTAAPKQQKSTLPSFEEYSKMRRSGKSADEIFGNLGGSAGTQFRGRTDTNGKETAEELASRARESVIAFDENGDVNLWQTAVNTQKDAQAYAEAKERYWQQTATPEEKEKREMQRNPQSAEDIQKAWDLPYEVEEAPFWSWVLGHPVYKPKRGTTLAEIHGLDEKASAGDVINKTVQDAKDSTNVAIKNLTDTSPTGNSYIDTWGARGVENAKAAQTLASTYGVATSALEGSLTQKSSEEYVDRYRNKTYGEKLAANVGITAANYGLDLANTLLTVSDTLSGGRLSSSDWGASIYRVANLYQNAGSELTSQAYASMRESSNWLGRLVLDIEKTLTEQGLDRLLGWGGGSLIAMGARSFGAGAQESENRGEGRGKQITTGLVRAGVEIGTEMMSGVGGSWRGKGYGDAIFSKLDKFVASKTGSEFLGTLAQAFSSEAVEEMVSDILNPLFDRIFGIGEVTGRGEDKTFMQKLGHYFADVWGDGQILYDGLLGGIAGLGGGATTGITNSVGAHNLAVDVATYKTAQRIAEDSSLKTRFEEFTGLQLADDSSDAITQIATYLTNIPTDENRGIKSRQIESDLENKITVPKAADLKTIPKAEMASVFIGARGKLSQEGVTDGKLADAIAAVTLQEIADKKGAANRFAPSDRQRRIVDESELAQRIVRELVAESMSSRTAASTETQESERTGFVTQPSGHARANQTPLASATEGRKDADLMRRGYHAGQDVEAYKEAWTFAADVLGAGTNMAVAEAREKYPHKFREMTDAQLDLAMTVGRKAAEAKAQQAKAREESRKKTAEIKKGYETGKKKPGKAKRGSVSMEGGKVNGRTYRGVDRSKLNLQQKKVVAMVEALADVVNLDYVIYDGEANTGGSYIQGGTVMININSGMLSGKVLGAATLSHELTHYLQDFAPDEYRELKDFITSEILKKSPAQFEKLVQRQLDLEPNLSFEAATDEVIANACQTMLLNSEAVTKLARQNMSLAEKITDWIRETAEKIKAAFEGVDLSDNISVYEAARSISDVMAEAQKLWDKALLAAGENYNAEQATGKKNTAENGGAQLMAWDRKDINRAFIDFANVDARKRAQVGKLQSLIDRGKTVTVTQETVDVLSGKTDWSDIKKAREAIKSILKEALGSDSVHFVFDGGTLTAYITADGRNHSAGGKADVRRAAMFEQVKALINEAEYIYSANHDVHSFKGLALPADTEWDSFEAAADIGGSYVPVIFSIMTNDQDARSKIYSIFADENGAVSHGTGLQAQVGQPNYGESTPNNSIADTSEKDKGQNQQSQKWGIGETAEEQAARKESVSNLNAENRILRARAEYWRDQTRQTKERTVRQQDTDRLANELLRKYGSKADKAEVKAALKELGDWLVQSDGDSLSYDELSERAQSIAENIISGNYALLDNSQQEQLDRLKDYLKSTPVKLTAEDWNDTGDEGFRKKYGRYFAVSENGRTIDSLWGEMAAIFGDGLFPSDTYAPGDMLNMIGDYLDLWKPQYGNEFEMYHGEAVDAAANDIIDAVLSAEVRQTPGTFADKAQQKLNAQIAKDKAKLDALRQQKNARIAEIQKQSAEKNKQIRLAEKSAKYEAVSKVKQHYQDMIRRQRNKRSDTAVRSKIKKLHKELSDMLIRPTEKRYVPKELVKATAEILSAVDITTGKSVKASAAFAELKVKYDALKGEKDFSMIYDETVSDMLQNLASDIGDGSIYDLTSDKLDAVYNTLKALKHTIQEANRLTASEIEATAFEAANQMMNEAGNAKAIDVKMLRKWIFTQATPESMFRMLGNYRKNSMWGQMFQMLNKGQLKQTQILMEGGNIFRELIDDKRMKTLHDQKNLVDIGLKDANGNAIKITRGMMLSVYMHLLNEENARHVSYGGFTVPRMKAYYKNKIADAFSMNTARSATFSEEIADINRQLREAETQEEIDALNARLDEIREETDNYMSSMRSAIENELTDYDREWIRAAQQFFDVFSKGKLNETTQAVYGFDKAQVDHYFPIHTDAKYRQATFDTITRDMSLENAGFMKERQNGSNPILLEDITDVINSQLQKTAQYCGLMPVIRNFNKVYGKARAGYENSVQAAVSKRFGEEGLKYIENLMADLNGARRGERNIFDELRGNMAGAALTVNLRVTMSQAASFPTAAAEIGYKPLAKALADVSKNPIWNKTAAEEIAKWTPLWWYRMQGFSMTELGDIKNSEQFMRKINDRMKWLTGWIQAADGWTTGALWQASKYYVDDNFSDLKKGSDAYMMQVAEVYNRVIERTQPDYTTLQRPDILRNPNSLMKQLTMFLTQRLQNTNLVYDAARQYAQYVRDAESGRDGVTTEDVKTAKTRLLWTISSQVVASTTIVVFKAIADFIMHNLKAYRDDDDELTAESISKTLLKNFVETLISNVLWGSEVFSALRSAISGDRYYGLSLNGVESFTDAVSSTVTFVQKIVKGDKDKLSKAAVDLAKAGGQFFGVPVSNMIKWGQTVVYHAQDIRQGTFMEAGVDWLTESKQKRYDEHGLEALGISEHDVRKMLREAETNSNTGLSQDETGVYLQNEIKAGRITKQQADELWWVMLNQVQESTKSYDKWLEGWLKKNS